METPAGQAGGSQTGLRLYNERLVLDLLRRRGAATRGEIARATRLTQQTATVIVNDLVARGLLRREAPRRGRVGQPSVPVALNPDGALAFGVVIGRRRLEVVTVDFTGRVRDRQGLDHPWPDRATVLDRITRSVAALTERLDPAQRGRLLGVGIAGPGDLHGWESVIGAPSGALADWRGFDIRAAVAARTGLQTLLLNDASCACLAEMVLGVAGPLRSALHIYVASFVGGGLILNGALVAGDRGNAAAIGSMPLGLASGRRTPAQLIERASLYRLRQALGEAAYRRVMAGEPSAEAAAVEAVAGWIEEAAAALAFAVTAATAVIDVEAVVVDGTLPRPLLRRLIAGLDGRLGGYNTEGLVRPRLLAGTVGRDARQLGGALLPIHATFHPDSRWLMKPGEVSSLCKTSDQVN